MRQLLDLLVDEVRQLVHRVVDRRPLERARRRIWPT